MYKITFLQKIFINMFWILILNFNFIKPPEKIDDLPLNEQEEQIFYLNYVAPKLLRLPKNNNLKNVGLGILTFVDFTITFLSQKPSTKIENFIDGGEHSFQIYNNYKNYNEIRKQNKKALENAMKKAIYEVTIFRKKEIEKIQKKKNYNFKKAKYYYYAKFFLNYDENYFDTFIKGVYLFSLIEAENYTKLIHENNYNSKDAENIITKKINLNKKE